MRAHGSKPFRCVEDLPVFPDDNERDTIALCAEKYSDIFGAFKALATFRNHSGAGVAGNHIHAGPSQNPGGPRHRRGRPRQHFGAF
jgi:hypothetical protein